MKKAELLAPAGDLQRLKVAILYGADAVFIGGKKFSLRAKANNFEMEDIAQGVQFAHQHHSKVYVTANILPHNEDLLELDEYLLQLNKTKIDAIITSSPVIMEASKRLGCSFELHLSTQQSTTNCEAIHFWEEKGITRVVLARELSVDEIKLLKEQTSLELEVFIHGGLCSSYSGRCTLSNTMASRDANRGGCAHSCRWFYDLYDEMNVKISSEEKPFRFGSKDLLTMPILPLILNTGVDSLKIEGRMKSLHYIATTVKAYRNAIDDYYLNRLSEEKLNYYVSEILKAENRPSSTGFLVHKVDEEGGLYDNLSELPTQDFLAYVRSYDHETGYATIAQRNYFTKGEVVELFSYNKPSALFTVGEMKDEKGEEIEVARHANQTILIKLPFEVNEFDLIRKVK